jgi:hypothetical protein
MGGGKHTIKGIIETLNSWKNQQQDSSPSQQGSILVLQQIHESIIQTFKWESQTILKW